MSEQVQTKRRVVRVSGRLREIVTVRDSKGKVLQKVMRPLMLEFYVRDVIQVIVGATLLAIPIAFTEEAWGLGQSLPTLNILGFLALSLIFIAIFVYYNYYRNDFKKHWFECTKRVLSTYVLSFLVVALFLTLVDRAPWQSDLMLALKRTIIITFPASMSAAIADVIK